MRIILKNIGKIKESNIEINGITVIAGENNSGKSTVGKALFSIFNGLHDYETKVRRLRIQTLANILDYLFRDQPAFFNIDNRDVAKGIISDPRVSDGISDYELYDIVFNCLQKSEPPMILKKEEIIEILPRIRSLLNVSEDDAIETVVKNQLDLEFSRQYLNIYAKDIGEICIEVKNKRIEVEINKDQSIKIRNPINFKTEVIYVDDPFVIDEGISTTPVYRRRAGLYHRYHLQRILSNTVNDNAIEELITQKGFQEIYRQVSSVCEGEIKTTRNSLGYQTSQKESVIDVHNVSTGMKTFMILKMLLMNGSLEYNGTIVLDEPEIHLHPEWQLIFAELIVLLQKEFHMNILLNTHSPYFLRAIEVYSAHHKIADVCKYYLAENYSEYTKIEDVTDNLERIYQKLTFPLQKLENKRWEDG